MNQPASSPSPPTAETAPRSRLWLHLLLFAATLFTTTATGALDAHRGEGLFPLSDGLPYSLPLMLILVCHEFGHYFVARLHRVPASLPYFIPIPPGIGLFGTMGAVITQGGTADRRKLIDIGAAGPLAGLVVAIPVLIWGLALSPVVPPAGLAYQEGNSVLYAILKYLVKGDWLPGGGRDVRLHPTAFAGWVGLLVTMINLLPIGQLDGGHIATAYFGNRYRKVARVVHWVLPWLSLLAFGWVYRIVQQEAAGKQLPEGFSALSISIGAALAWFVWYLMLALLGRLSGGLDHPFVDEHPPLPRSRIALFWVVAISFFLIFMPVPLRYSIGGPAPAQVGAPP
jgi:membrane-associated protease RseP (regulator of RpoE activity)